MQKLFTQKHELRIVAVIAESGDRALVCKAFRLAAPVIFDVVAECGVVDRDGRKWHLRPEFVRIAEMLAHKSIRLLLAQSAEIHDPQRIVAQNFDKTVVRVTVVTGVLLLPPKIGADLLRYFAGALLPHTLFPVFQKNGDARKHVAVGIGIGHVVHRLHGNGVFADGRRFPFAGVFRIAVSCTLVFPRIPAAPAFQTAVAVAVAVFPEIFVKPFQAVVQFLQVRIS